jgi:hypothetical protein
MRYYEYYRNAAGGAATSAAGATPWGAIASAASSVLDTTITGIFNAGKTKAQKEQIQAQTARINQDARLDVLSNSQKQQLAEQMAAAQTESQREKLLSDAAVSLGNSTIAAYQGIKTAQVQSSQNMMYILGGGAILILAVTYFITQKNN